MKNLTNLTCADPTANAAIRKADKRKQVRCNSCENYSNLDWNCGGVCKLGVKGVFVGSRVCDKYERRL